MFAIPLNSNKLFIAATVGITALLMNSTPDAMASVGGFNGGGGTGIFCPAGLGQPSVQMLDGYEATVMRNLTFTESTLPYELQIDAAVQWLDFYPVMKVTIQAAVRGVQSATVFLKPGVGINVPGDIGTAAFIPVPTGCSLGAVGFYQNGQLFVSTDAFSKMSETQKAMFYVHEAVYKLYRDLRPGPYQASDVRKFVTDLFTVQRTAVSLINESDVVLRSDINPSSMAKCVSDPGYETQYWYATAAKRDKFVCTFDGQGDHDVALLKIPNRNSKFTFTLTIPKPQDFATVSLDCRSADYKRSLKRIEAPQPISSKAVITMDGLPAGCDDLWIWVSPKDHSQDHTPAPGVSFQLDIDGETYLKSKSVVPYSFFVLDLAVF